MRLPGRLTEWNDEKGYGFLTPPGGGDRVFVHIKAFVPGSRRPVKGDIVSYLPGHDAGGRPRAEGVRHAGRAASRPRVGLQRRRPTLGAVMLAGIAGAGIAGWVPLWLVATYLSLSAATVVMYWADKAAAGRGGRRTPENTLHLASLVGGWPGALIAQQHLRHKSVKRPFQVVFWITVALNLAGAWWLLDPL